MEPEDRTVTIVITTYNHAHFLDAAIESVKRQTVAVDEIIVVDDGSTDDPARVVRRHPDVRLIRQANQGLAAARNTGLRAASGAFIAFLDADDLLRPTMVEVNLRQFAGNLDCAFVYGAYVSVDASGKIIGRRTLRPPGSDAFGAFLSGNIVGMHGTVLYRRELIEAEGGFDVSLPAVEDHDLYLRLARKYPVAAQSTCLAEYRRHGSNMSSDAPFMLATALAVHERYRDVAATRPEWQAAFRRGTNHWKKIYARGQLAQLLRAIRTRSGFWKMTARTFRIALIAPLAVVREASDGLKRIRRPAAGSVRFGDLRRTVPVSTTFGYDRGKPIDRRYIESFLESSAADVRGRVLEIGDSSYTRQIGGNRVTCADVLNRHPGHPETTFVGDLSDKSLLPPDAFDCIVLTQTLHLIFDMPAAVAALWRALRPSGTLLVTVPWISPIDRGEWGDEWCWSISSRALERLLCGPFVAGDVSVRAYGNVLAATAFLYGLAEHELSPSELDVHDPHCAVIIAGRAVKAPQQS